MSEQRSIARWFLGIGVVLAVGGLILWRAVGIASAFPPYLVTAVLALGYGAWCLASSRKKPTEPPPKP